MISLDLYSARGDVMPLAENPYFSLTNISGMTRMSASMSSSVIGGADGDTINSIQAQPRTMVLDLRIKSGIDVIEAKNYILSFVKAKKTVTIVMTKDFQTTQITGIVSEIEMPRFSSAVTMQISLHCEQPFWEDAEFIEQTISEAIGLHYFTDGATDMLYFPAEGIPFGEFDTTRTKSFFNDGDVSVGLEITINAVGIVTNPIIYDQDGKFFGVGYGAGSKRVTMESGDIIKITTIKGNKTATLNGINILDKIKPNSTWLQLDAGANQYSINSDDDDFSNMHFYLTYKRRFI